MTNQITAVVLAAGQGTRMKSLKSKVLHAAAGRSLIDHVLSSLHGGGIENFRVVVGFNADEVKEHLKDKKGVQFFVQREQRGTADAVKSANLDSIEGPVLICNGDHPLITGNDYRNAVATFQEHACDILVVSCEVKNPFGFGRIVRSQKGRIMGIVEEKDATRDERHIREINSGLYVVKSEVLKKLLPLIKNDNKKKEFYITDLIGLALTDGLKIEVCQMPARVVRGVNTQSELALASRSLYRRKAQGLMDLGVAIIDPATTYIDTDVQVGQGSTIQPGVMISGPTIIGDNCLIESHCSIKNSEIAGNVEIKWGSVVEGAKIRTHAVVGPYARVRPESIIGEEAHVGNFVELKKTTLGARVKANHLTYLGDAEIGEDTNIGCGTITCNYATDKKKYKTKIGKNVFVGSDSQFVAPVIVGDGAVIGSGSTITKDVPENALAVARARQFVKTDYTKRSK
jgi:bifunctional UDP-N-acetylglucosamine pyrophosphorylase/glucosamine-1-phosphate N-acetyltransferase